VQAIAVAQGILAPQCATPSVVKAQPQSLLAPQALKLPQLVPGLAHPHTQVLGSRFEPAGQGVRHAPPQQSSAAQQLPSPQQTSLSKQQFGRLPQADPPACTQDSQPLTH
jgi:hypothetical protein